MRQHLIFTLSALTLSVQSGFAQPAVPQICTVTVDDLSTHNIVYWDKTGYDTGDSFILYRENMSGGYTALDTIAYDSLSEFHDYGHDPNISKTRYKIAAMNATGTSAMSPYHGTIYCNESSYGHFDWNGYEVEGSLIGPVLLFIVQRQDSTGGPWNNIDSLFSTIISFIDPVASAHPYGSWRVRTYWPLTCTSTKSGVSTSRSNIRTHANGLIVMTGLQEVSPINNNIFNVYPNPAASQVTIQMYDRSKIQQVKIYDAYGQLLQTVVPNSNRTQLDVQSWNTGMYYIEVLSEKEKQTRSFIKL